VETLIEAMPLLSMLLFLGIFALVLVYVFTDRRQQHIQHMAAAALDDGRPVEEETDRG
jgi:cbb3-type cytochrome oxidase subunit 3